MGLKDPQKNKAYKRAYYLANKERLLAAQSARRKLNPQLFRARDREYGRSYRAKHPDEIHARQSAHYRANKEKIVGHKNTYRKKRYFEDIQYRLIVRLRNRLRQSLKYASVRPHTAQLLGCSLPELKKHLEKQFRPGMTWSNHSHGGWHIDHIRPLSSFDLVDPKQLAEATHYSNLCPLWAEENLRKAANYQLCK